MSVDITIKRGDTGKILSGQLLDANGVPPDFSGYTTAKIWMKRGGVAKIAGAAFTFVNAAISTWQYACVAGDVDTRGRYKMELEVVKAGATYTFPTHPTRPYLIVLIKDDLG